MFKLHREINLLVLGLLALFVLSCGLPDQLVALIQTPTPTPTNTPTPTATFTPTLTPTVTNTPLPTFTPRPTATPFSGIIGTPNPSPEVIVSSTLSSGWIIYQMQTSKFSLALPPAWQRINLDPNKLETNLSAVGDQNPQIQSMFSNAALRKLVASGVRFVGIDVGTQSLTSGFPTNVNVLRLDTGLELPLDVMVAVNLQEVTALADPTVPVTHTRLTLANIQAEEINYQWHLTTATGTKITVAVNQFLMIDKSVQYVYTCESSAKISQDTLPRCEQIGKTFTLLK